MSKEVEEPQKWLSIKQFGEPAGLSTTTVRRMIARGEIRAFYVGPKLIRIEASELQRIMREVNPSTFSIVNGGDAA